MKTSRARTRCEVLVVDDDGPIRVLMENVLREFGFRSILADSGSAALELARRSTPDLILLDLHMPGMSGEEAIARIRGEAALQSVPIIILSGRPVSAEECRRLGADDWIQKPFDVDHLIDRIDRLCARDSDAAS